MLQKVFKPKDFLKFDQHCANFKIVHGLKKLVKSIASYLHSFCFVSAAKPEKKFSFLNDFELAKMKEEEERRIANMTRAEFAKLTSSSPNCSALIDDQESRLADEERDKVRLHSLQI